MTLDEAIKDSEQLNPLFETFFHRDYERAHKLGIEAMREIKLLRQDNHYPVQRLLPGETEE